MGVGVGTGVPPPTPEACPVLAGGPTGTRCTTGVPADGTGVTEGRPDGADSTGAAGPPDGPEGSGCRVPGALPPDRAARRCTAGAVCRRGTAAGAGRRCGATGDRADGAEGASARVGVRGRTAGAGAGDTGTGAASSGACTALAYGSDVRDGDGADVTAARWTTGSSPPARLPDSGDAGLTEEDGGTGDPEDAGRADDVEDGERAEDTGADGLTGGTGAAAFDEADEAEEGEEAEEAEETGGTEAAADTDGTEGAACTDGAARTEGPVLPAALEAAVPRGSADADGGAVNGAPSNGRRRGVEDVPP